MSEKELTGYKGQARKTIQEADAEIGDLLRVTKDGQTYEGILIPRSEYGNEDHIVIKLKNGYNIGIHLTPNTKIEKIGKGTKPSFAKPPISKQNPKLPKVTVLSTGGTIASRVDYRTGAVRPALTASDLHSIVPELTDIAQIDAQILFSLFSENIVPQHWTQIAKAVAQQLTQKIDGVVIAHGTDTLGYTAAALSFALQNLPVPVVLVGSQRSADRPSSDAATNLIGAVITGAKAPFAQVVVAMHETVSDTTIALHLGTKVRKCHTSRRDAFKSVNAGQIAKIENKEVTMLTKDFTPRDGARKLVLKPDFNEKVALIKTHPGINPALIEWYVAQGFKGVILEGTGLGHAPKNLSSAIRNAVKNGVLVAMTSQCIWGRVNMNVYESGRDLQALGVVSLEDMLPETALVKLMWVFGQTQDKQKAEVLLKTNIAGEYSPRTLLEETGET
jgi:glutamyl-tRNA(Gln) amidotransferase subunit D